MISAGTRTPFDEAPGPQNWGKTGLLGAPIHLDCFPRCLRNEAKLVEMEQAVPYRPYLNIYIVWHPDFSEGGLTGQAVAEKLYREFCRDPDKPMSTAIGIPIYFRTSAVGGVSPLAIDFDRAQYNVVVFLVDSSMVLDVSYETYAETIGGLGSDLKRTRILAFVWPKSGVLRLGNTQQIALALDGDPTATVRMKLAAETCRLLQSRPRGTDGGIISPEPPMLFISHAKRDAEDKAEELKSLIEKTPIDTFFDKVNIAAGYDFTAEIGENIKRSAVLAWQSDEYGSRPWCNIELLTAKEYLRPIVVVLGVKTGEERSFPYLGNVRTIVATGENFTEIIIAAVREYLRKLYVEGHFQSLAEAGLIPDARFRLFRPAEPIDGALLERKSQEQGSEAERPEDTRQPEMVLYPDPPLSTTELAVLGRLFPEIKFVTPITADQRSLDGLKVALSISESDDATDFGQSRTHLLSSMIEIARHILSRGGIIAYGGDLRNRQDYGLTRQLFQLVYAYKDLNRAPLERIWNFLAHHIAAELPKQEEAMLLELAKFEKPLPDALAARFNLHKGQPVPDDTPEHRYIRARCLTAMREAMAAQTDARIVMGGRVSGHQGKYPGILEEAALVFGAKPLYLVGAFGGCTHLLIRVLRDKERPEELTAEYQRQNPRVAKWKSVDGTTREEKVCFDELSSSYRRYESDPVSGQGPIDYSRVIDRFLTLKITDLKNGLTKDENLELFETPDLDRIVSLLVKGLAEARGSRSPNTVSQR